EKEVLDGLSKNRIIRDSLVQRKVRVHDFLDYSLDLLVEREPHVLAGVDPSAGVEGCVVIQPFHHLADREPVLLAEVQSETFIQLRDDLRKRLQLLWWHSVAILGLYRIEMPGLALEFDL